MFPWKAGSKPATQLNCLLRVSCILTHMPTVLSSYLKKVVSLSDRTQNN